MIPNLRLLCRWQDVVRDCNTVLALPNQSKNIKALFRRSLARSELGEEEQNLAVKGELWVVASVVAGRNKAEVELCWL